jgi:hypothetical protein
MMLSYDALTKKTPTPTRLTCVGRGSQKSCYRLFMLLFALTLRDPPGTLRGPLRGASRVEEMLNTLGARRAPNVWRASPHLWRTSLEAPRSGPRRAPGGSVQKGAGSGL